MKNNTTGYGVTTSRFLARFGGRFLCRSPPEPAAGRRLTSSESVASTWLVPRNLIRTARP
jgi:hypothetical protein